MSRGQRIAKRAFDLVVVCGLLAVGGWLIPVLWLAAAIDTGSSGFFRQERIGQHGKRFELIKIRTMRVGVGPPTNVTRRGDPRVTRLGSFLRRLKLDELPQLVNVLRGEMSIVGPRPDVPGFADRLAGSDRIVLTVRPGLTGPATLRFRGEEDLLEAQEDPEKYNSEVIWPEKVKLNVDYVRNFSLARDLQIIAETVKGVLTP